MNYKKQVGDFEKALSLTKQQVTRLKNAIEKAYDQEWGNQGANVDEIYAFLAPYIKSPEEAFYVGTVVVSDVMGAMMEVGATFPSIRESNRGNPNVN